MFNYAIHHIVFVGWGGLDTYFKPFYRTCILLLYFSDPTSRDLSCLTPQASEVGLRYVVLTYGYTYEVPLIENRFVYDLDPNVTDVYPTQIYNRY